MGPDPRAARFDRAPQVTTAWRRWAPPRFLRVAREEVRRKHSATVVGLVRGWFLDGWMMLNGHFVAWQLFLSRSASMWS